MQKPLKALQRGRPRNPKGNMWRLVCPFAVQTRPPDSLVSTWLWRNSSFLSLPPLFFTSQSVAPNPLLILSETDGPGKTGRTRFFKAKQGRGEHGADGQRARDRRSRTPRSPDRPPCFCVVRRQLYAQDAACRLQAEERDGKSLQRLSKEEYLKMMLPDDPAGDRAQKVSGGACEKRGEDPPPRQLLSSTADGACVYRHESPSVTRRLVNSIEIGRRSLLRLDLMD